MKRTLAICLSAWACVAHADVSALVFGASHHGACDSSRFSCDFNQSNPGLGLEWSPGETDWGRWLVRGGTYHDSYREQAYFLAGGWRKEWTLVGDLKAGVGLLAGYLHGSGVDGFGVLPMASVQFKRLALEVGYIPKTHLAGKNGEVAVTTFTLRWDFY
ncbi:hypothetical protein [Crenobacter cavernae]|uniref:Uncharacterized protein n=1 Tax=Crenobacter cavernae TaxID=2290923 RepID=A0ABY0FE47_9NEIS|nr:hypothetical protein [Crenobacter cavernae]RXZ42525.1 hypothetical protein EBB06_11505 [Crenobacter cavernae]